tara:strand:+ start:22054 stop:22386 length:333 start_codon:yes stop_codon:yes gene_type:complete
MNDQLTIDFSDLPDDMTEGFWQFHRDNPGVYVRLVAMTRIMRNAGRTRIGIGMLFEVLRWEYWLSTESDEPFKLNNNYRAYYSRLIEQREPDLRGMFTKRKAAGDEAIAA